MSQEQDDADDARCIAAFQEIRKVFLHHAITIPEAAELGIDIIVSIALCANNGDQEAAAIDLEQGFMPDFLNRIELLRGNKYDVVTVNVVAPSLDTFDVKDKKPN